MRIPQLGSRWEHKGHYSYLVKVGKGRDGELEAVMCREGTGQVYNIALSSLWNSGRPIRDPVTGEVQLHQENQ